MNNNENDDDEKLVNFENFSKSMSNDEDDDNNDNNNNGGGDIFILKKEGEDYGHFLINIVNTISTYSQLIKLCANDENGGVLENAEKIKIYSKEIKNNSEYLAKLLLKMDIKEKKS